MFETPTPVSVPEASPTPEPPSPPFTERLSDTLQHLIQVVVGSQRKPPRRLKSLLNGTWFGHPLHPVITDVPITAWLLTAIFDVIWLIAHTTWAGYGGFVTVIVGLLGALGAIVTGLTDWSDTYGAERRVGFNHALFNATATILYLVSLSCGCWPVRVIALLPLSLASWGLRVSPTPPTWVGTWCSPKAQASTTRPGKQGARITKR